MCFMMLALWTEVTFFRPFAGIVKGKTDDTLGSFDGDGLDADAGVGANFPSAVLVGSVDEFEGFLGGFFQI